MKELIKKIEEAIADCKKYNEDMDDASWGYQQGVLLTANEAIKIVNELKKNNSPTP